ncbi:MAG TPA: KH domain-containing protein, partial [archaeon]|nr:KH domain-containing protein [archaeon]
RPVVEVRDFETKKPEYEIYSYGEENVVIPISGTVAKSAIKELAKQAIFQEIKRFDHSADIEVVSDNDITVRVRNDVIPAIIGKGGMTVEALQKKLGLHINIEPKEKTLKSPVSFLYEETGGRFNLMVDQNLVGEQVDVYSGEEFLLSPMVGKEGKISIKKNSDLGRKVLQALASKRLRIVG